MNATYYDALLPVGELGDDDAATIAGLRLLASVFVPAGQIVVALASDSSFASTSPPALTAMAWIWQCQGYGLRR